MNISVFDQVTVSEHLILVFPPALYQTNLGIVSGSTYRLSFETEITSGIVTVYQGSQLIYSSAIVFIGSAQTLYETINVTERMYLDLRNRLSVSDNVTLTESVSMAGTQYISVSDTVTITENFARA